jgi:hypothetical protein
LEVTVHRSIHYKSYTDELSTVPHTGGDRKVKRLIYTTVTSLMMDQRGLKHVGADVFQLYCDSDELYAFVGLQCGNFVITHGMENVKNRGLI